MKWPQAVILALLVADVVASLALHGSPRKGSYNFPISLLEAGLTAMILHAGGFWK